METTILGNQSTNDNINNHGSHHNQYYPNSFIHYHQQPQQQQQQNQQIYHHQSPMTMTPIYHFKILVPAAAAGRIIGKGGTTIAQLQKDAGARVKMSKASEFYPGTTERVCLISGPIEGILKINDFFIENFNPSTSVKILVPNSTAGMIIGKGGSYIKLIKERSGAYVQISQKSAEFSLPERCVTIVGEQDNIRRACAMILNKIVEDSSSSTSSSSSAPSSAIPVALASSSLLASTTTSTTTTTNTANIISSIRDSMSSSSASVINDIFTASNDSSTTSTSYCSSSSHSSDDQLLLGTCKQPSMSLTPPPIPPVSTHQTRALTCSTSSLQSSSSSPSLSLSSLSCSSTNSAAALTSVASSSLSSSSCSSLSASNLHTMQSQSLTQQQLPIGTQSSILLSTNNITNNNNNSNTNSDNSINTNSNNVNINSGSGLGINKPPTTACSAFNSLPLTSNPTAIIETIRMVLQVSGFGEDAVSEISSAMSTLASYGVLGVGLGLL